MIRIAGTCLALLTAAALADAQGTKKDIAVDTTFLRDLAQTRSFQLGRPVRPYVTPDGKAVLFLRSGPRSSQLSLFEFDVATGKTRELLTPAQVLKGAEEKLSPEEKAARERMRVSAAGFTNFQLNDEGTVVLQAPSEVKVIIEKIEAESADVVLTAVDVPGTSPGRAYRVVQLISQVGDHSSVVRFTVRRDGGSPHTVPMAVFFHGTRN